MATGRNLQPANAVGLPSASERAAVDRSGYGDTDASKLTDLMKNDPQIEVRIRRMR